MTHISSLVPRVSSHLESSVSLVLVLNSNNNNSISILSCSYIVPKILKLQNHENTTFDIILYSGLTLSIPRSTGLKIEPIYINKLPQVTHLYGIMRMTSDNGRHWTLVHYELV